MGKDENDSVSTAFTVPTGEVLQSLPFWNQIQLAYSERRQALGQAAATLFVENAYWQDLSMYQTWQNWLEANCTSFIDHVNGPIAPDNISFLMFTVETWRAAAGLHADGFSRFDMNGTRLAYGIAQEDDAIVANTITELQDGFSALKWESSVPFSTGWVELDTLHYVNVGVNESSVSLPDRPCDIQIYIRSGPSWTLQLFQTFTKGGTMWWGGDFDTEHVYEFPESLPRGIVQWDFTNINT